MTRSTPGSATLDDTRWSFLSSTGEMDELTRAKDWSRHPLGDPEGWPASLKTVLGTALSNRFPQFIFWGPELFCFYNDAYRPSLGKDGKHPFILGMRAEEAWAEIWSVIKPLIDQVMSGGGGTWSEDQLIPIYRNGHIEDVYWTFSYSPITDEEGVRGILVTCVETTGSVLARRKAEAGEAQFRLLADSMPQFVWVGDPQGNLHYFNRALYAYSGLSEEQLRKDGWLQIVHPHDREQNLQCWTEAVRNGTDFRLEHRFKQHDGAYRWQLSRAIPVRSADGQVHLWVGTSTDIHDIKQLDQEKDYFITVAGHELRNPLSALRGYLELLHLEFENTPDTLLQDSMKAMDRQVTSLTQLVNGLVDVSRIRAGLMELEYTRCQLDELVATVVNELGRVHTTHAIAYAGAPGVEFEADRNRIAQVLTNLLTNAVKYAPESRDIQVIASVEGDRVVISVRDRGIGISESAQQRIFERFYRVAGRDESTYQGFGIGLSLAADIVRLHGGDIGVRSAPGEGSTFWFSLPLDR